MKNMTWKLVNLPFKLQRMLFKTNEESEEVPMLILTNFDSFSITCLI